MAARALAAPLAFRRIEGKWEPPLRSGYPVRAGGTLSIPPTFAEVQTMKRTEIERRERELKRAMKKASVGGKGTDEKSVGDYINELVDVFIFNEEKIWNTTSDEDVLEVLEEIQIAYPEKAETIVKKAIRKTKVAKKDEAFEELSSLMG